MDTAKNTTTAPAGKTPTALSKVIDIFEEQNKLLTLVDQARHLSALLSIEIDSTLSGAGVRDCPGSDYAVVTISRTGIDRIVWLASELSVSNEDLRGHANDAYDALVEAGA